MLDLNKLCKVTLNNANLRNKNGGHIKTDTRSMLKHTATEVIEAMEAYTAPMIFVNSKELLIP